MTENMLNPNMPFVPKTKKNAVLPIIEEQLQKSNKNLPPLDLNHHKTSCDFPDNYVPGTQNNTNQSARGRSVTFDSPKVVKKSQKSPTKRHKFSMELCGGRLDSFGYPIIKGGKKHRISFKDDMVKVIKVENWKSFNFETNYENRKKCICQQCSIF